MGPTAAGKTDLAIELAKQFPVEIMSVDSALVYRGMDIGTAKPNLEILQEFPHHLIDIAEPSEPYSVGNFRDDALRLMAEITSRGKIPLLVGGTMLYFRALQQGLADLPTADTTIRAKLDADIAEHGLAYLHAQLKQIDPIAAARIHINDTQRIQRALEVYLITGQSMTELTIDSEQSLPYKVIKIILSPQNRAILHQRIAERYKNMITAGFLDEVKQLFARSDCHADLPAIRAVGYRQAWAYLEGEYDQETLIEKAIIATRQMAKRQLTWLRSQQDGMWFDSDAGLPIDQVVSYVKQELFL
jgi:tRNA dimethylallyltransferase